MPDDVIWQPTAKQAEFLRSSALECLYGGAMGSGKSDALLAAAISQVENSQHRGLLLRRSFPMRMGFLISVSKTIPSTRY